jgi:hypothetical protein
MCLIDLLANLREKLLTVLREKRDRGVDALEEG